MAHAPPTLPRIVLTGPGGWIGSAFLATIAARHGTGWADRVSLFGSHARTFRTPDGTAVPVRDLADLTPADVEDAHVIHLSYLTKDKADNRAVSAFMSENLRIDEYVIRAMTIGRPKGFFVASSGAARLAEEGNDRHPYGVAKLMQEDMFGAFARQSGIASLIGRIYNLAGPYINKVNSYALASLLSQAFAGGAIRVSAAVPVFRSFLHVADLAKLVLLSLERGDARFVPVDLCGPQTLEMGDIALAAARAAGRDRNAIQRPTLDLTRPSAYLGDATQTLSLALACGLTLRDFDTQVADTATYLRDGIALLDQHRADR